MVKNYNNGLPAPQTWGDVRVIVLGDSHIGGLSFKEIPLEERPKLRARSYKNAQLHTLLPLVGKEIKEYKPHLLVLSVGSNDLIRSLCQHFIELDHQHRVKGVCFDFSVKLAVEEIFRKWRSWLAKYNCKIMFALTYPVDFTVYNKLKLQHCPECQEAYDDNGQREILIKRIKEWGESLMEKNIPVMYLDDVLKRINPDYMTTDPQLPEEDRALIDGLKIGKGFAKNFFTIIRESVEKEWPNFIGGGGGDDDLLNNVTVQYSPTPLVSQSSSTKNDEDEPAKSELPPKKKTKHAFRF